MSETIHFHLRDPKQTAAAGQSLAKTLYPPTDLLLRGELGAGKTTFVQELAKGLGIHEPVSSPTYALEQRYSTPDRGHFIHMDLYRLEPEQTQGILLASEDHDGIRCIEWADRLKELPAHAVSVSLAESSTGRDLTVEFGDILLPDESAIDEWRSQVHLPENVVAHCEAVGAFAERLAKALVASGRLCRPLALRRAGQVHDLLRFIDFREEAIEGGLSNATDTQRQTWTEWKTKFNGLGHEAACAAFLRERGYRALGDIVEPHGLMLPSPTRRTTEQQLLFYADKRVKFDQIVSLEERFDDFRDRYSRGKETEQSAVWFNEARQIERMLFPEDPPF